MNWYKIAEEQPLLQLSLDSDEDFRRWLRAQPKERLDHMQQQINHINNTYAKSFNHMLTAYHGTNHSTAQQIQDKGFELTRGLRSGFMGAHKPVQNQAVFLSLDPAIARAYSVNRSDLPGDATVIPVKVDIHNTLDLTNWNSPIPLELRKLMMQKLNEYAGSHKRKPTQSDMFWFIDQPEIVYKIKEMGYDSVIFNESRTTQKALGVKSGGPTLAVFDPGKIYITEKPLKTLTDIREAIKNTEITTE